MLLTLLVLLSSGAVSSTRCPDLSGRYVLHGEDNRVYMTITQTRCARITIAWKIVEQRATSTSVHTIYLDGKFHRGGGLAGASSTPATLANQLVSGRFRADTLEIIAKPASLTTTRAGQTQQLIRRTNKDLCVRDFDRHGRPTPGTLAALQASPTTKSEDAAALRSEKHNGC
jgi:hypothetical protein